jgi:SIR2-like domain
MGAIGAASMWSATARGRRIVADLAAEIGLGGQQPRVALMIGAGFDMTIRQRPNWPSLLETLALHCGMEHDKSHSLKAMAAKRPVEAAEALKITVGSSSFWEAVRVFVSDAGTIPPTELGTAVNRLINRNIRLIVNFNYTSDLLEVISGSIKGERRRKIRVIERLNLASWNLQQLLFPEPGSVHVIHIHGLVDPHMFGEPGMVFDRRSYDQATLTTSHYQSFLTRVFQDFTVLTIGMSWNDFPLLSIAARLQFESPISSRLHCALLPHGDDCLEDYWHERGMVSSYGVRPLLYRIQKRDNEASHAEAAKILLCMSGPIAVEALSSPPTDDDLVEIASKLDSWGDYESGVQSDWMALNWEMISDALARRCKHEMSGEVWLALASIERHLRHFLWFYLPPAVRVQRRQALWRQIAVAWSKLGQAERDGLWDLRTSDCGRHPLDSKLARPGLRAIFEYAIGAYELGFDREASELASEVRSWREMLQDICRRQPSSIMSRRVYLAEKLWSKTDKVSYQKELLILRRYAAECAWEAIEAKLALDQAQIRFESLATKLRGTSVPRDWTDSARQEILALSEDARNVSRMAGCIRREVGAVVLGSFVAPSRAAERSLIAVYERVAESSGRRQETSMIWWVIIGLLAVYCDSRPKVKYGTEDSLLWLTRLLGVPQPMSMGSLQGVKENSIPHWRKYHKDAADLAAKIIRITYE